MKKFIAGLYMFAALTAQAYVNIYPLSFDKQADGGGSTEVYKLYNGTMTPVKYTIYIDRSEDGRDMSQWVEYYPKSITLNPGKEGEVRVMVKAPEKSVPGEYGAVLGVKEMPVVKNVEELKKQSSGVRILTDLRIHIAAFVGKLNPTLEESKVTMAREGESLRFSGNIRNTGERRGKFSFYLTDGRGKDLYPLGEFRILKGRELNLSQLDIEEMNKDLEKQLAKKNILLVKEADTDNVMRKITLK